MFRHHLVTILVITFVAVSSQVGAQYTVVYSPVGSTVVPAPSPVVMPQSVVVQRPLLVPQPTVVHRPIAPVTTYVAPQPYVVARPVVPVAPAPAVTIATPMVATPVTVTRHRPILGGTVTRTYYRYQPAPVLTTPVLAAPVVAAPVVVPTF